MHPSKQRVEGIAVVVQLDAGLAGKGARHPADVLHDPAAARDRNARNNVSSAGRSKPVVACEVDLGPKGHGLA